MLGNEYGFVAVCALSVYVHGFDCCVGHVIALSGGSAHLSASHVIITYETLGFR